MVLLFRVEQRQCQVRRAARSRTALRSRQMRPDSPTPPVAIPSGQPASPPISRMVGITTTQIYDKRRRSTSESASHDVPI